MLDRRLMLHFLLLESTFLAMRANAQTVPGEPPARFMEKKYETVNGYEMAYVEVGTGDPIVFLHGNPTSSYLWRNVMPHLEGQGRLIAPDLIGMGSSGKLPSTDRLRYSFQQHANYLYTFLEQIGVKENITFVIHDWGSALGFHWAFLNRGNAKAVKAIAFMEAIVAPLNSDSLGDGGAEVVQTFEHLRGTAGERLILEENVFIETFLPQSILRTLTNEELNQYREPFLTPGEDRRPMLTWARQLPINGLPEETLNIVTRYAEWLKGSEGIPKLFIKADPGARGTSAFVEKVVSTWPNVAEITVPGIHYLQEDSPELIGKSISMWLDAI